MSTRKYNEIYHESKGFKKRATFTRVLVTPELAAEFLKHNTANRPLKPSLLAKYVRFIKEDKWIENGDSIRFDLNAHLTDGQHRLQAIVNTGIAQYFDIITGLSEDAFKVTDTGKPRTKPDVAALLGYKNYKHVSDLASFLISYDINEDYHRASPKPSDNQDISTFLEMFSKEEKEFFIGSIVKGAGYYNRYRTMGVATYAFIYYILAKKDPARVDDFMYLLTTGDGVGYVNHSPIFVLRKKLDEIARNKNLQPKSSYKVALVFKAWNLDKQNKTIKSLSYDDRQDYPIPA